MITTAQNAIFKMLKADRKLGITLYTSPVVRKCSNCVLVEKPIYDEDTKTISFVVIKETKL